MQGNHLPESRPSPRLENGVLYWYAGNNFELWLDLSELQDQDGVLIDLDQCEDEPELTVRFYNVRRELVHTFSFGEDEDDQVEHNMAKLVFDDTAAAHFPKGRYFWRVDLVFAGEHKTLLQDAAAVVE